MTVFSKLTCYEVAHPWTPSCTQHTMDILKSSYLASLKIYVAFYLLTSLLKKNKRKYFSNQFLNDVLRSANFLAMNTWLISVIGCTTRKYVFRQYSSWSFALVPATISSFLAVLTEDPSRRRMLAVYMASVAIESAYRSLLAHRKVPAIPNADIILFSIASSSLVCLLKKGGVPWKADVYEVIKFIVGPYETSCGDGRRHCPRIGPIKLRSARCSHPESTCLHYAARGACKMALLGLALQLSVNTLLLLRSRRFQLDAIAKQLGGNLLGLGSFLGSYVLIVRALCCLMRHLTQKDATWHGILAGFVASFSLKFYRSIDIPIILLSRLADLAYEIGVQAGSLPSFRLGSVLIYTISTALTLHIAAFEPTSVKPSYYKSVIYAVSGGHSADLNRRLMTEVSSLADKYRPHYWPRYDPRFVPDYMLTDQALKVLGLAK